MTDNGSASGRVLAEARFQDVDAVFLVDVRGWLSRPLRGWAPRLVRDVAVVLGELMTNAFRHAGPPFAVRVSVPPPGLALRVEVHDGAAARTSGWTLGRGLLVVRDLCQDWGVEHRPDGKIAWAEVPIPVASETIGPGARRH
ncbi:MAG TPA: ATP-binding protein [Actinophytocola sp.]|jgi:hypothetical protein|uniref:ATP-binding protein n=1 Tax=Actinophytocola sp. TaxID=1872138 RepID=UPI002F9360CB